MTESGETHECGSQIRDNTTHDMSLAQLVAENLQLRTELTQLIELKQASDEHVIVTVSDAHGIILEANQKFVEISKYTHDEIIGAPQSIVNSGYHSAAFWSDMWSSITRGQTWHGEIRNRAKDGSEYWVSTTIVPLPGLHGNADRFISLCTATTSLHQVQAHLRDLAYTDPLTQLPNRTALFEILDSEAKLRSVNYRGFVTVAVGDLRVLNQTFGFGEGDRLLMQTAQRLLDMYPKPHTVARIDNSTFGLIFDELGEARDVAEAQASEIAAQVIEEVGTTMRLGLGFSIDPAVRVGYTAFHFSDRLTGEEVFQRTEIARRHNPEVRRAAQVSGYRPSMFAETEARIKLVLDLRHAIAHDQMRLFLQPIVNTCSVAIGYECLVRWQHPERGLVAPAEFIPLAEQSGLIVDLGVWVLKEACRILGVWALNPDFRHLTLSVNVSERQLNPVTFSNTVHALLEQFCAPPERLKIEVTESLMHDNIDQSIQVLNDIRRQGIEVSLDDFGTGYASLSYLARLPVSQLKIDRSFVIPITQTGNGAEIVHAIVKLAHVMGLHVVAEGVETAEQYQILRDLGVDSFQGYYFGKPSQHALPATV